MVTFSILQGRHNASRGPRSVGALLAVLCGLSGLNAETATYLRPDLTPEVLDLRVVNLASEQVDDLVGVLARLVRNFPQHPKLTLEWRSRILALALRLRPEDRACLVAHGQLARSVQPLPVEDPTKADVATLTNELLKTATALLKSAADPESGTARLGLHLLSVATQLDPANGDVLAIFKKDAPPLCWDAMVPHQEGPLASDEEEATDLLLTESAAAVLAQFGDPRSWQPLKLAAKAAKLPAAARRKPLQVHFSQRLTPDLESRLAALRTLLKEGTPHWPTGWSIQLEPIAPEALEQPASLLGIGLVLEGLIQGEAGDGRVIFACGLDPATGKTTPTVDWSELPQAVAKGTANHLFIVPEISLEALRDLRLGQPEKWAALRKMNLFSARNFQECTALAATTRPPALQRSLAQYQELPLEAPVGSLRTPAIREKLESILTFHPNYLAAQIMLEEVFQPMPTLLSLKGSASTLNSLAQPMLQAGTKPFPIRRRWANKLDATPWAKALGQITRVRPRLAVEARSYADTLCDLGKIYDQMVLYPPQTEIDKNDYRRRIAATLQRLQAAAKKADAALPPASSPEERDAE